MKKLDYDNPVAVTDEIFWTGFHDKEASLHCNSYLLIDEDEAVFIDPGSIPHFPIVMRKVLDLIDPDQITTLIAQHQDPDVCGNMMIVEDMIDNPNLKIAAHINTIRLIRHYGIRSEFYAVEENDFRLTLKSGRVLEFVFTPYLHSPGAIATYDPKTKSLFTSDIFAAIDRNWTLFAEDDFLSPMDVFHQQYMPNNAVLKKCMEKLEEMDIDRLIPQHGSILEGDDVHTAIQHLKHLPCGTDLM